MKLRLQKYIRDQTGVSRRKAEELISAGLVTVGGKQADLGMSVDDVSDVVELNGEKLGGKKKLVYIMMNKPSGFICSRSDPHNPKTVYDLLPKEYSNLFPIGRLDIDTEGLLMLTNDGDFSYKLTHPKFEVEKEYYVLINGKLGLAEQREIEKGIKTPDLTTSPARIKILRSTPRETSLSMIIHEGQNREIKRIFAHFGYKVAYLKRIRVANYELGDLPTGQYVKLTV
ncbi:MAG: ribosomal large subunit pseudouridine synthase B [uncultured bacterium]|nr:MAG: ribosomal large subunit pseudouridine synthase B [uncultured bacterium]